MKEMLLWLRKRHEENAVATLKRPIRSALIVFVVLLVLLEVGTVLTFYMDMPGEIAFLGEAILLTLGIALWITMLVTGWMLTPVKIRRSLYYGLRIVPLFLLLAGGFSYLLLIEFGVKAMNLFEMLSHSLLVVTISVIITWTLISGWGWIRYAQGRESA